MLRLLLLLSLSVTFIGCSITRLPNDLGYGVLNNDDLQTAKDGLPTYLLILDGSLVTYPNSESLLLTGASLNSAYSGVFVEEPVRKLAMTKKAYSMAQKAMCLHNKEACGLKKMNIELFESTIKEMSKSKDLPYLYSLGSNWTGLIQLTSDDWNSIAELTRVQMMMEQIVRIDSSYENGMALVYLGVLNSLVPPALGGKPDVAKKHFEAAISISNHKNLIAKVMYADQYAKLLFEEELHNRLLQEVLDTDPHVHGLTLQNVYAQKEAQRLLDESEDYFF